MAAAELWVKVDAETQAAVDEVIVSCAVNLREAGFRLTPARFPFGLHHDYYRVRLRVAGRRPSHAEVAVLLNRWAAGRGDRTDYAKQAVCGAVLSIIATKPDLAERLPPAVESLMAEVERGSPFLRWAREFLAGLEGPLVAPESPANTRALLDELL